MTALRSTFGCALGAVVMLLSSAAMATPTTGRHTTAQTAIPEAALPKLAEAKSLEARGRLVASLAALREALGAMETGVASEEVLVETRHHVEELARAIPRVAFVGALPPGAVLSVDGVVRGEVRSFALDPGDHDVAVEAPGRLRWRATFHLERRDSRQIGVQPGPALGLGTSIETTGAPRVETTHSPFLRASAPPPHVAGELRLAIPRIAPVMVATEERAGRRLCARETCNPEAIGGARAGERIDSTLFRQMVEGAGVDLSTTQGMVLVTPSTDVVGKTRVGAAMTSEKAVFALTGRW